MHLDLVDSLRCVRPHQDSWLVAVAERVEARHLVEGVLGCPVCATRYPVRAGIADFADGASSAPGAEPDGAPSPAADEAVRLAALLGLDDTPGVVLLAGGWARQLALLHEMVPAVYVLVNAIPAADDPTASALRVGAVLPFAARVARGVAIDAPAAMLLPESVRVLRAGGRLVAPADVPLPDGVRELARDARHWVAERVPEPSATPPQPLLRRV